MDQRKLVEELFIAAADLPTTERAEWLAQACGDDLALRSEVESLLGYDGGDSRILSRVVRESAVLLMNADSVEGLRIGPWRIVETIGRGGMGAVYRAVRDDAQFTKQAAIKFIRRGMDTPSVIERFLRERQILASLDHPYIAKLLDGGSTVDGIPYIVMEFVEGTPVDLWCQAHKPSLEERCDLFRKICEAVAYAHRRLVVHRDLKPTNILVTAEGTPMLLDFGIAKLIDDAAGTDATATVNWVMTPDYASPEQIRGQATTTATDVYSLGIVFYQLLTGSRPYSVDSATPAALERTVCEQQPPRPSAVAPQGKLAGDLDNIVMMALRKEPERRYTSVEQFSEDVRRYLHALPVIARDDTFAYRTQKFVRRNRTAVLATALTVISLAAAVGVSTMEARRAGQARIVAETQRQTAERERERAEKANAAADIQRDAASKASVDATAHAREAEAERAKAESRLRDLLELGNHPLLDVQATLERVPGALQARKDIATSTLQYLDRLRAMSGDDKEVLAVLVSGYTATGDVLGLPLRANLGDQEGALAAYGKGRAILDQLSRVDPANPRPRLQAIGLHQRTGVIYKSEGKVTDALAQYNAGLAVAQKLARDFPKNARAVIQVGIMEHEISLILTPIDLDKAETHARLEVAAYERVSAIDPNEGTEGETIAYSSLGRILNAREKPVEAAAEFRIAMDRNEKFLVAHPNDGVGLGARASYLLRLATVMGAPWQANTGEYAQATRYAQEAVAIYEKLRNADRQNRKAAFDLENALAYAGAIDSSPASVEQLQRSVALSEELLAPNPKQMTVRLDLAFALEYLGRRKFANGDIAGAIADYRKSLENSRAIAEVAARDGGVRAQIVATQHALSEALTASGESAKALDTAREAADTVRRTDTELPPRLRPMTLSWVGDTYSKARDANSACKSWREAQAAETNPQRLQELRAKLATCN